MIQLAASVLALLSDLLAPLERRLDPLAIPIRRNDWRGPRGDSRRH